MKTIKTLVGLLMLLAANFATAQCVWVSPSYQGGGAFNLYAWSVDSLAPSSAYTWTFDDGGTATGNNVQHSFTTSGQHSWCVSVAGNCSTPHCDTVNVNVCDWQVAVQSTEGDTVVHFSVPGAQPGWTYSWSFPDGAPSTSTSATPTIVFPGPGIHNGQLNITTPAGCNFTLNAGVNITTIHNTGPCSPWAYASIADFGAVNFTVMADSMVGTTYQWDFGDGTGSTQQYPTHTYAATGVYTYCVSYTGPNCSGTVCGTVDVNVCANNTDITYTQSDSTATFHVYGAQAGSTYAWSFPNGYTTTSTAASPSVTFPGVGTYPVSVTISTPSGCTYTRNRNILIEGDSCVLNIYPHINGGQVDFYTYTDTSGTMVNWTFGDGTTGTGVFPTHTYAANGTYTYCATVNGNMCTNTVCGSVNIDVCQFSTWIMGSSIGAHTGSFAVANAPAGSTYSWSFASGTPATSTSANPTVTFAAYGTYGISVTLTPPNGCVKNLTSNFTLTDPCNTHFTATQHQGGEYYFEAHTDTLGWLATYNWDFGDGTTATGTYPYHVYTTNGTYIVCLSYSTPNGCSGTICDTLNIDVCDLHAVINSYTVDSSLTFYVNADSLQMWDYNWSFTSGTPATSTAVRPSVTFPGPGTYPVTLTYTAHNGCTSTITYNAVVSNNTCDTNFSIYYPGLDYIYPYATDTGTGQNSYYWTFGDGTSTSGVAPIHYYTTSGTYLVCMTVTTPNCTATNCKEVNITIEPTYSILGYVTKNAQSYNVCDAYVYLIKEDSGFLTAIDTFDLTADTGACNSHFYFTGLPGGTYYLKAALASTDADYANYLPTYSTQHLNWADADAISFSGNSHGGSANVDLIPGTNPGGPGFVGGWVTQGAGLGIGGGADETRAAGDPLPGIQINLLNAAGAPVGYTYSDANGHFSFGNLALGTYKIYAEVFNKTPIDLTFTLTQNNPSVDNVQIEVNSSNTVGVQDLQAMFVDALMPNPTNATATLAVTVKQSATATLTIRDLTGRTVSTQQLQLVSGANNIAVNVANQPDGVYFIELAGQSGNRVLKLVKTH